MGSFHVRRPARLSPYPCRQRVFHAQVYYHSSKFPQGFLRVAGRASIRRSSSFSCVACIVSSCARVASAEVLISASSCCAVSRCGVLFLLLTNCRRRTVPPLSCLALVGVRVPCFCRAVFRRSPLFLFSGAGSEAVSCIIPIQTEGTKKKTKNLPPY
jgi:hypothetical protein